MRLEITELRERFCPAEDNIARLAIVNGEFELFLSEEQYLFLRDYSCGNPVREVTYQSRQSPLGEPL
jgi:hypothetical protein